MFVIWMLAEAVNPCWSKLPSPIRRRLSLYAGFILFLIAYIIIAGESIAKLKFIWIFMGINFILDFILPALNFRDKRSYAERIQSIHQRDLSYDSVLDKIAARTGKNWILICMIVIFALFLAYSTGIGNARKQIEYSVLVGSSNEEVILRQYGSTIISAQFNRNTKRLNRIYTMRKIEGEKYISFQPQMIGPLASEIDTAITNIQNLEGRCLEQMQMKGDYFLDLSPLLSIAYRENQEQKAYLLVEPVKTNSICGAKSGHAIMAVLPVEKAPKNAWYGVNFDCTNSKDVAKGDTIIGLFEGKGLSPTLKAWKVDQQRRNFQKVNEVVCKSFN